MPFDRDVFGAGSILCLLFCNFNIVLHLQKATQMPVGGNAAQMRRAGDTHTPTVLYCASFCVFVCVFSLSFFLSFFLSCGSITIDFDSDYRMIKL